MTQTLCRRDFLLGTLAAFAAAAGAVDAGLRAPLAPVSGRFWPSVPGVVQLQVGEISVAVIEDRKTVFAQSLFKGIEKHPERVAMLAGGKAPGVVKSFLVRAGQRLVLIDSGYGAASGGLTAERLKQLGVQAGDMTDILLTHLDGDHIGGLAADGKALFPNAVLRLSCPEYDGWIVRGDARSPKAVERARAVLALYEGRVKPFAFDEEVISGITARDASGHTVGHTRFDIDSNGSAMTIVGDLLHAYPLQMRFTAMSSAYDADPVKAVAMRKATLEELSGSGSFVSGMHVQPMGWVVKCGTGYDFMRLGVPTE